ncbi:hypothetical protein PG984_005408 [Apiospora sp. TS-2023a]
MNGSSDRGIYGGATPIKPSHAIKDQVQSPSKKSMSKRNTKSYISTKNGGGDPVTALALRSESSSQSTADRQARVAREMAAALAQL